MKWAPLENVLRTINIPSGYTAEQLTEGDVPHLISELKRWYPDICVGSESCHLDPQFLTSSVSLAGTTGDRSIFSVLMKRNETLAAYVSFEKDPRGRKLLGRLLVVSPEHRHAGLGRLAGEIFEKMGRAIGVEIIMWYSTLKHPFSQELSEKLGFQLVGIIPGNDRDRVAPSVVKRVTEALYVKLLIAEDEVQRVNLEKLTPRAEALWKFLFPM